MPQTLQQVRKLRSEVHRLQQGVDKISAQMDEVLRRVQRIDVNVAEVHLRETLRHHLKEAWDAQRWHRQHLPNVKHGAAHSAMRELPDIDDA